MRLTLAWLSTGLYRWQHAELRPMTSRKEVAHGTGVITCPMNQNLVINVRNSLQLHWGQIKELIKLCTILLKLFTLMDCMFWLPRVDLNKKIARSSFETPHELHMPSALGGSFVMSEKCYIMGSMIDYRVV